VAVKLPSLVLDTDPRTALQIRAYATSGGGKAIEYDASDLTALQPVGVCLLAQCAKLAKAAGKALVIRRACPQLKQVLESTNCTIQWRGTERQHAPLAGSTIARCITSQKDANTVANQLSAEIAQFIPAEDREAMLQDQYGRRIHHAVQPALAYIFSELLDNVFSHSRTTEHPNPSAWLVAQWYAGGDLVRLAVVDDGCGLLTSLRGWEKPPNNHFEAASLAFEPFVSSKNIPLLYAERRHMGLGLTVCRDICQRLQGRIYAASGNARVTNAGLEDEIKEKLDPYYQGTIVSLEFHRRAATTRTLRDILAKYSGSPDLRARFD
jgi:hypothetical protein